MDPDLKERLKKTKAQIDLLYSAEEAYLTLEAVKEHKLQSIAANAPTTLTSVAAITAWAHSNDEWALFKKGLAISEARFHREKHILDLMNNAFQAEYLSAKIEYDMSKKT